MNVILLVYLQVAASHLNIRYGSSVSKTANVTRFQLVIVGQSIIGHQVTEP